MALFREPEPKRSTRSDEPPAPVAPPMRDDSCPSCGTEHFTPGGPVVVCRSNGQTALAETRGAVLSCLGCGERWYQTPKGLKKPHEAALPPAWAATDLNARVRAEAQRREGRREERPTKRMAGPHEGFAMPPKV